MSPSTPFVDRETGELDVDRIVAESIPLAKLIGLVAAVALVPGAFGFVLSVLGLEISGLVFSLASRFVLAVGSGVVLLYVLVRASEIADE